jgi:hypothetical protein
VRWLWVLDSVDGRHKVGNEPVCLVGEEEYGWQTVMEVEDDGGWNGFWVRDENLFRGQGARGRIEPTNGSRFAVLGNWFHAATAVIEGGERSWIWAAVSLSTTTMGPPHLGQSGSADFDWSFQSLCRLPRLHRFAVESSAHRHRSPTI